MQKGKNTVFFFGEEKKNNLVSLGKLVAQPERGQRDTITVKQRAANGWKLVRYREPVNILMHAGLFVYSCFRKQDISLHGNLNSACPSHDTSLVCFSSSQTS